MDQNTPSMSARGIAFLRAYHHKFDEEHIFDDKFAQIFVSPQDWTLFSTNVVNFLAADFEPTPGLDEEAGLAQKMRHIITTSWAFSRDRFIADKNLEALQEGFQQFVILGAGFDTFALRCKDSHVRIVEIDHPATQRYKAEMISQNAVEVPTNLHLCEANFEEVDFADILVSAQCDSGLKTMFVWAGLNMYLTERTVQNMLGAISSVALPGSRIVFDYVGSDAFEDETRSPRMSRLFQLLVAMGEPIITGFTPDSLDEKLRSVGIRLLENVTPQESYERYFKGKKHGYQYAEHVHFALAEITGP